MATIANRCLVNQAALLFSLENLPVELLRPVSTPRCLGEELRSFAGQVMGLYSSRVAAYGRAFIHKADEVIISTKSRLLHEQQGDHEG